MTDKEQAEAVVAGLAGLLTFMCPSCSYSKTFEPPFMMAGDKILSICRCGVEAWAAVNDSETIGVWHAGNPRDTFFVPVP